jgi:hypothetical protein
MTILFWLIPGIVAIIALYAVYLGGGGRTRLHRIAAVCGALAILGLLAFIPVAVSTAIAGLASTHDVPFQELPQLLYLAAVVVAVGGSAISIVLLSRRRGA